MDWVIALTSAIVGGIIGGACTYGVARYQVRQANEEADRARRLERKEADRARSLERKEAALGKVPGELKLVLSRNTADRLKKDPGFEYEIKRSAEGAFKVLWLDGYQDAATDFYDVMPEYYEAVDNYAKGQLDYKGFERMREKKSDEVADLLKRHRVKL